jgi:hypothetical protein
MSQRRTSSRTARRLRDRGRGHGATWPRGARRPARAADQRGRAARLDVELRAAARAAVLSDGAVDHARTASQVGLRALEGSLRARGVAGAEPAPPRIPAARPRGRPDRGAGIYAAPLSGQARACFRLDRGVALLSELAKSADRPGLISAPLAMSPATAPIKGEGVMGRLTIASSSPGTRRFRVAGRRRCRGHRGHAARLAARAPILSRFGRMCPPRWPGERRPGRRGGGGHDRTEARDARLHGSWRRRESPRCSSAEGAAAGDPVGASIRPQRGAPGRARADLGREGFCAAPRSLAHTPRRPSGGGARGGDREADIASANETAKEPPGGQGHAGIRRARPRSARRCSPPVARARARTAVDRVDHGFATRVPCATAAAAWWA